MFSLSISIIRGRKAIQKQSKKEFWICSTFDALESLKWWKKRSERHGKISSTRLKSSYQNKFERWRKANSKQTKESLQGKVGKKDDLFYSGVNNTNQGHTMLDKCGWMKRMTDKYLATAPLCININLPKVKGWQFDSDTFIDEAALKCANIRVVYVCSAKQCKFSFVWAGVILVI